MLHALAESQDLGKLLYAFKNVRNMEQFLEENAYAPDGRLGGLVLAILPQCFVIAVGVAAAVATAVSADAATAAAVAAAVSGGGCGGGDGCSPGFFPGGVAFDDFFPCQRWV